MCRQIAKLGQNCNFDFLKEFLQKSILNVNCLQFLSRQKQLLNYIKLKNVCIINDWSSEIAYFAFIDTSILVISRN